MVRGLQLACSDEDLDEPMDAEPGLKGCSAVNPLATQIDVQTTPIILLTVHRGTAFLPMLRRFGSDQRRGCPDQGGR